MKVEKKDTGKTSNIKVCKAPDIQYHITCSRSSKRKIGDLKYLTIKVFGISINASNYRMKQNIADDTIYCMCIT